MMLLAELKDAGEDFEWYPTTSEIIGKVCRDLSGQLRSRPYGSKNHRILDVGAGDGRVLVRISECLYRIFEDRVDLFAIEKSHVHINNLPKQIVVIGTDFTEQSLVDKPVDVIFSNPPYSQYEQWTVKLIRESAARLLYIVIPSRWRKSPEIQQAIKMREASVESIGEFDFENADRQARARVEVVRLKFKDEDATAFDTVIEEMLPELERFDRFEAGEDTDEDQASQVVESGASLIVSLVMAYDAEVKSMVDTYAAAVKISPKVLAELGVTKKNILAGIRSKIEGLKDKYWKSLFARFAPITKRLATKQRRAFLESLGDKAVIDFTESNIYAMLIWVTKWSNDYFDEQLIQLFRSLSEFCNVVKYKSNDRVWEKGDWRYLRLEQDEAEAYSRYKLEYRIVLQHCGGISTSQWKYEREQHRGLMVSAFELLQDIVTVANNLGFDCNDGPGNYDWESNKQQVFHLSNGKPLVAVRAFKNGNLHLHFNPKVMLAINVEAGRLLGWIRSAEQAVDELQATKEEAEEIPMFFKSSFRIASASQLRLT